MLIVGSCFDACSSAFGKVHVAEDEMELSEMNGGDGVIMAGVTSLEEV